MTPLSEDHAGKACHAMLQPMIDNRDDDDLRQPRQMAVSEAGKEMMGEMCVGAPTQHRRHGAGRRPIYRRHYLMRGPIMRNPAIAVRERESSEIRNVSSDYKNDKADRKDAAGQRIAQSQRQERRPQQPERKEQK